MRRDLEVNLGTSEVNSGTSNVNSGTSTVIVELERRQLELLGRIDRMESVVTSYEVLLAEAITLVADAWGCPSPEGSA